MSDNIESIDNCIICFYPLDKEVALLSCGHKYHFDCLKSWITNEKQNNSSNLCCICNKNDIEISTVYNESSNKLIETSIDNSLDYKKIGTNESDTLDKMLICCTIL